MNNCYIGVDVGGTNVRVSLFDESNLKIQNYSYPFIHKATVEQEVELNICKNIDSVMFKKLSITGIGLSLAATIDRKKGVVVTWPNNASWNGYDIAKHIKNRYNTNAYIEDDANCAGFGEFLFRSNFENLLYITVGTGVGCGIIVDKKIYVGEGFAGELGHIKIYNRDDLCVCGKHGCLQSIISGPALLKKYNNLLCKNGLAKIKSLKDIQGKPDEIATDLFNKAALLLSNVIRNLVMILDLRHVVFGGGVILNNKPLFENLKNNLSFSDRKVIIEKALLKEYSGSIGVLGLINKNKKWRGPISLC